MWDQLLTKLTELWNTLIDALQKGIEHAPLYLQDLFHRYTMYNIVSYSIGLFIWLLLFIVSLYLHSKVKWWTAGSRDEGANRVWFHMALGIVSLALFVCWVAKPVEAIVKYVFLPEIQIIQDLKEFNEPKHIRSCG